jgi:hypothetical protein
MKFVKEHIFAKFTPTINKIFFSAVYDFTSENDCPIHILNRHDPPFHGALIHATN